MKKYCKEVHTVTAHKISKFRHLPGIIKALFTGQPLDSKFVFYKPMVRIIQDILKRNKMDLIQIEHSFMAEYVKIIPKNHNIKKALTFHNICYVQYKRLFQTEKRFFRKIRNLFNWLAMETWEPRTAALFDKCITVSEIDKEMILKKGRNLNISVVPNGIDIQKFIRLAKTEKNNLIFIGKMSYQPNEDAVLYFVHEIFPFIKEKISDAKFYIVGPNPPEEIIALAENKNIIVTGFVKNLTPYYRNSKVSIVPLRAGGGTRLKILESMGLGRPVVSTSIGCEGICVQQGRNIFIADDPSAFARRCIQLMSDKRTWNRITKNGRELVEKRYSWEKIGNELRLEYESMIQGPVTTRQNN
ncbi:MAG: glycosyltransferase family 4 protein [bacterium]|nr:glycosyltransferase family 4 protein [bacterium]